MTEEQKVLIVGEDTSAKAIWKLLASFVVANNLESNILGSTFSELYPFNDVMDKEQVQAYAYAKLVPEHMDK